MPAPPTLLEEAKPDRIRSARLDFRTGMLSGFVVVTNVLGNFSLSWGMKHATAPLGVAPLPYIRLIFSPWVLAGTILLTFWLLSRMTLLGWADLSYVLPITSSGYILTALAGKFIFAEQISWIRWMGTALIVAGMILVGLTIPNTTAAARSGRRPQ